MRTAVRILWLQSRSRYIICEGIGERYPEKPIPADVLHYEYHIHRITRFSRSEENTELRPAWVYLWQTSTRQHYAGGIEYIQLYITLFLTPLIPFLRCKNISLRNRIVPFFGFRCTRRYVFAIFRYTHFALSDRLAGKSSKFTPLKDIYFQKT